MGDWTVNPKTAMWINIALSICVALVGAGAMFTTLFGELVSGKIVAAFGLGSLILGAINATLHALSTRKQGPLASYLGADKSVVDTIDIPGQTKGDPRCR